MSLSTGILKGDQCIHYDLLQSSCIVVHVLKWPWTSTIMFIYLRPWSLKFSYYEISTLQRSGVSFNQKKGSDKGRRTKKSRSDIIYNQFPTHLFGHIMHFFWIYTCRQLFKTLTWAPRAVRVSMRTAVCVVMWRQPAILAPFRGLEAPCISLICIKPGISFSAISMHFRPQSARLISATIIQLHLIGSWI